MRAFVILTLLALVPRPAEAQQLALEWLGHDADKVSRDDTAAPDGITDLHYRLVIRLDGPASIRSIVLRPIDGDGQPVEDYGYGTADSTGPLLAVEREGEPLNEGFTSSLGEMEGESRIDLYTEDFGTIDTGSRIRVEVAIESRPTVTAAFTLAPPPGRLLGHWSLHCSPGPNAFEPMTLSGRLWLDLGTDGTVAGNVDGIPLAGSVRGDSLHAAGESSAGRASLSGALVRPRGRGARPRAEGWIDYKPTGERCTGGPWRSD